MQHIRIRLIAAATLIIGLTPAAFGQLAANLTPWGAEKSGNAAGSIPAYTGGVKAPANFKSGDKERPDPFAADKPLYTITAANMAQYAAQLTPGTQAMLKQYPESFKVVVYPTRRSVWVPESVQENSAKNATRCKTMGANSDGLGGEGLGILCHAS